MADRTELRNQLTEARRQTDKLFRTVRPDALYDRTIPERHRIVFYLGHLEAFDWNLLARQTLGAKAFHPSFDRLFAFGIDPPAGELPSDTAADWPGAAEIAAYNERTREWIDNALPDLPEDILHAAIEHRLMHAETLAYILHQLPYERKVAEEEPARPACARPQPRMVDVPAGIAMLGKPRGNGFGWDNEYDAHCVPAPAFSIMKYKVTNGEYLEFVRDGGSAPPFWAERHGQWFYRGMFRETPLPPDWPVYATKTQAEEYAQWRGGALPTEAQFHRASEGLPLSHNLDFHYWDPIPVTADDPAEEEDVPSQMWGNGWEWTATPFGPFKGFEPFPFYPNYSAPFFDGEHFVLKGASPRTAAAFLRPSFRNWFRPSYPYIYSTFRLVQA